MRMNKAFLDFRFVVGGVGLILSIVLEKFSFYWGGGRKEIHEISQY